LGRLAIDCRPGAAVDDGPENLRTLYVLVAARESEIADPPKAGETHRVDGGLEQFAVRGDGDVRRAGFGEIGIDAGEDLLEVLSAW